MSKPKKESDFVDDLLESVDGDVHSIGVDEDIGSMPKSRPSARQKRDARASKVKESSDGWFAGLPHVSLAGYPYSFDMMSRESDRTLALHDLVDGFQLAYNRGSDEFSAGHTVSMNDDAPSYQFQTSYSGEKATLFARMGGAGDLFALGVYQLAPALSLRSTVQLGPRGSPQKGMSVEANVVDDDSHTSVKAILNPQQVSGTLSYMQSITRETALGCEFSTTFLGGMNYLTCGLRQTIQEQNIATAQVAYSPLIGPSGYLTFTRKCKTPVPNTVVDLSTKLEVGVDPRSGSVQTNYLAGAEVTMRQASYKGQVDGNGVMRGVYKQAVTPFFSFSLSSVIDVLQDTYKFGVGLSIDVKEMPHSQAVALEARHQRSQAHAKKLGRAGDNVNTRTYGAASALF